MLDVGWLGSPVDVATFLFVTVTYLHETRPTLEKLAASVVALAHSDRQVDHEQLASTLEVDPRDVDAVRPTVVTDGGDSE